LQPYLEPSLTLRSIFRYATNRGPVSRDHRPRRPLALEDGLIQPLLEADLAESRVAGGNQRALAEFGPEVPRVRVNDNLARVVARAEALTDQFIEAELLGTGHFNRAIQWPDHRH